MVTVADALLFIASDTPQRECSPHRDPSARYAHHSCPSTERDLETAIVAELQQFITELGNDFAFLDRQKRITIDGEDYYLDLLFFHRRLHRLVAIELKLGNFTPARYSPHLFFVVLARWRGAASLLAAFVRVAASDTPQRECSPHRDPSARYAHQFCRLCSLAVVVTVADALLFIALSAHGLPSQLDISFEEGGCR